MTDQFVPIPDDALPEFDELYSISDLHLGGLPGFQIFNSGDQLKNLIDHLRTLPAERRVALVINGDFVDFLAEAPSRHFDPYNAIEKLNRISSEPAFAMAWQALQEFTQTVNRTLIVNLGNHDLELALPWVRHRLLEILSDNDPTARGRIAFSFEGAGVRCRVGNATVLCVHGNEVDDWNLADYETLRRIGRDIVQGKAVADWQPNAGAKMVIEVMNDLKKQFPFVDLLKPEVEGVLPTLAALAANKREKLDEIAGVASRLAWDTVRRMTGFLSAEEAKLATPVAPARPSNRVAAQKTTRSFKDDLLLKTEERLDRGIDPLDLVQRDQSGEMLGFRSALWQRITGAEPSEVLRDALEQLQQDRSYEFGVEDATFTSLDGLISGNIDFLIAGHTHLERALCRKQGRGFYFNSGTWARLIKLENDVLTDADKFRAVYDAFAAGSMQKLDDFPNLVLHRLTVVSVWTDAGKTHGELRRVDRALKKFTFTPVDGTRFTKA
ncbi:MAG TPA: metallophosphoesterase [Blastocatellia bacterium]|nr:metallophosphoesterase [Blastocatellia bacterium]